MGDWVGVIGIVLGAVSALLSVLIFLVLVTLKNRSLSSYDHRKREVELSAVRSRYERDVAGLAERLSATEQRWLEVNNLVLEGQQHVADRPTSAIVQAGIPLLRELAIPSAEVDNHQIFVLTPFSNDEDGTYELIRAACRVLGYRCIRGDEEFKEGDILKHAVTEITRSWLVIANITSRNANVFYELGICHTIGKPTILLSRSGADIPFDVQSRRIITFDRQHELTDKLTVAIRNIADRVTSRS